jgi:hypothetical protein
MCICRFYFHDVISLENPHDVYINEWIKNLIEEYIKVTFILQGSVPLINIPCQNDVEQSLCIWTAIDIDEWNVLMNVVTWRNTIVDGLGGFLVFNATFNNIAVYIAYSGNKRHYTKL